MNRMSSEESQLERARRFEQEALVEIYDEYSTKIYRYATRLLGDEVLAEDCVSETFSRFLSALKDGGGPSNHIQAYLYRVAHNWITDSYRRQPPPTLPFEPELHAAPDEDDLVETVWQRAEQERIRTALRLLTPEQRQVLVLKFIEDLSNREIALALDKPIGAIKALQHRGLAALRRILEPEEEELHAEN